MMAPATGAGRMQVVILAGGAGVRMGALSATCQKCVLPIAGVPLLHHVLDSLVAAFGTIEVTLAVRYRADDVAAFLRGYHHPQVRARVVRDVPGAPSPVYEAVRPHVAGSLILLDGDVVVPPAVLTAVWALHATRGFDLVEAFSTRVDRAPTHAVARVSDDRVVAHWWPPPARVDAGQVRGMDVFALNAAVLDEARHLPEPDHVGLCGTIAARLRRGCAVGAVVTTAEWLHVATATDLGQHPPGR